MNCRLSKTEISSFRTNVLPLYLISDCDISKENITWKSSDESVVFLTVFNGEGADCFRCGVLLTLCGVGEATVSAFFDGKTYTAKVFSREIKSATENDTLLYFRGDFHDHTSNIHKHDEFESRESGFVNDMIDRIKEDGRYDFAVISDHGVVTNNKDFFLGFYDSERAQPMRTVMFPGSESEVTVAEPDRYGLIYKNSGEIVIVNAENYSSVNSWEEFYSTMQRSPFAIAVLAHPYIIGYKYSLWNFSLHKNNTPRFKELLKGIEMGNGGVREANGINEYMYSKALDNGFFVSTTCSSDCHGPEWRYDAFPGKTVICAYEHSKEAFLDALAQRRFYASESANVKVAYTVNGHSAPCKIPCSEKYRFNIRTSYFTEDESSEIILCRLISDKGKIIAEFENEDFSDFTFETHAPDAHYFYLRFTDREMRRTWSFPVLTEKETEGEDFAPYRPIGKDGFSAIEVESGRDASTLINDDPLDYFTSNLSSATYLIDMKKAKTISALGHYSPYFERPAMAEKGISHVQATTELVSKYRITASMDGVNFELCAEGQIRCFSGEEILPFEKEVEARYLKFEVLSTTGKEWRAEFAGCTFRIAELTPFEKAEV